MEENGQASDGFWSCGGVQGFPRRIAQEMKKRALTATAVLFVIATLIGAFIAYGPVDTSIFSGSSFQKTIFSDREAKINCSVGNVRQTCSKHQTTYHIKKSSSVPETCPEHFRWIHEDLKPWKDSGITAEMVENARRYADIRIVVVNGSIYMEKYRGVFQTRDVFTIWGILQLLRFYPRKLPDLDLMFNCGDMPMVPKSDYNGANAAKLPPLFHYCADNSTLDIVFPDWSFWGWPEISIPPWNLLQKNLEEGNHRIEWTKREPYAYWKGNIWTGNRKDIIKCKVTDQEDWNARIYNLDWHAESRKGFKNTKLEDQCHYRYKIYLEGNSWSVSEKYILACDSMSLLITPRYYDFFTRTLLPTIHYWPIKESDKCRSIKLAVEWGNTNKKKAQMIGNKASRYVQEQLKMKYVYDYMFHLLNEYGKLLKYKPTVPPGAVEMCLETMACNSKGLDKKFKIESMVEGPSDTNPCTLQPPYSRLDLEAFLKRKESLIKKVEDWEQFLRTP